MPFDDARHFTFSLEPGLGVLLVSDAVANPAEDRDRLDDAYFVEKALEADPAIKVVRETTRQFQARTKLTTKNFAGVFLLNLARLAPADWSRLASYVRDGGGLVVAPGDRARPDGYNDRWPPGSCLRSWTLPRPRPIPPRSAGPSSITPCSIVTPS